MWYLYIIECKTKDLYVGIAQDVANRIKEHNNGSACRYTKYRHPVRLIYQEEVGGYREARRRERQVKTFSRVKKLALADKKKDISP